MNDKVIVDTGVLIGFYNRGYYRDSYLGLLQPGRIFFSSVSINEFIRGAHDSHSKELVTGFLKLVQNHLLTPTQKQWIECGRISEQLLKSKKRPKEAIVLLQNDILIALQAKDLKATLVTCDVKDFKLIKDFVKVEAVFW